MFEMIVGLVTFILSVALIIAIFNIASNTKKTMQIQQQRLLIELMQAPIVHPAILQDVAKSKSLTYKQATLLADHVEATSVVKP